MAMRDDILKAIKDGGATKESLLALTGTTDKGLASQFTYLRMMGHCPMRKEDGTFTIVSADEWEAHRQTSGTSAAPLTPEQRLEKAQKREKRASTAYDNAIKRFEADEKNRLNELKKIKAEAELEIASIELGMAEAALSESGTETPGNVPGDIDEEYLDEGEGEDFEEDDLV